MKKFSVFSLISYGNLDVIYSFLSSAGFFVVYPPKGVCERRSPKGVHFSKLIQERNLTHQFQELISAFLKSEKCFIPQRESANADLPKGSILVN